MMGAMSETGTAKRTAVLSPGSLEVLASEAGATLNGISEGPPVCQLLQWALALRGWRPLQLLPLILRLWQWSFARWHWRCYAE
jgi:hypothetical protein